MPLTLTLTPTLTLTLWPSPNPNPHPTPHPQTRTRAGCRCANPWRFQSTYHGTCANPDDDPGGAWCLVEAGSCQQSWAAAGDNW